MGLYFMRAKLTLALILLVGASIPAIAAQPHRVASLNLCVDQILLEFLPKDRIALLSQLANDKGLSHQALRTVSIPRFDGSVESIIRLDPDLVLGGQFTATNTVRALRRLGYEVQLFNMPETLQGAQQFVLDIAQKVGVAPAAQRKIAAMNVQLNDLQSAPATARPKALIYLPNGLTVGSDTLKGELVERAGMINLATKSGINGYGEIPLETVVQLQPDVLLFDSAELDLPSMAQKMLNHPALQRLHMKSVAISTSSWICPGTMNVDAINQLIMAAR